LLELAIVGLQKSLIQSPERWKKQNASNVGLLGKRNRPEFVGTFHQSLIHIQKAVIDGLHLIERVKGNTRHEREQYQYDCISAYYFPADGHDWVSSKISVCVATLKIENSHSFCTLVAYTASLPGLVHFLSGMATRVPAPAR
jgi:hypothetical protein